MFICIIVLSSTIFGIAISVLLPTMIPSLPTTSSRPALAAGGTTPLLTGRATPSSSHGHEHEQQQPCSIPVFYVPSMVRGCTFYQTSYTQTVYTDCGGCELVTKTVGHGIPCMTITTVPGVATKTVKACATSTAAPTA